MDGVDADIMTFAKGIGSGFPMAGVATREDTFDGIAAGQLVGCAPYLPPVVAAEGGALRPSSCLLEKSIPSSSGMTSWPSVKLPGRLLMVQLLLSDADDINRTCRLHIWTIGQGCYVGLQDWGRYNS